MLALAAIAGTTGGCGGDRSGDAARVAERFYAAVAAKDGARACTQLTPGTATQLEKDEGKPCAEAVVEPLAGRAGARPGPPRT